MLWHDKQEEYQHIETIYPVIQKVIIKIESLLEFTPERELHFCMYSSNKDAQNQLNRPINRTMLMAPLSSPDKSLIVLQSPAVDQWNGDINRMNRHIAHEVCHQFINEKSSSQKSLGDNNANLNTPPWFNEGLAEVISHKVANIPIKRFDIPGDVDFELLDEDLENLFADIRTHAFGIATSIVNHLIQFHGVKYIFDNCMQIKKIYNKTNAADAKSRAAD